MPVYDDKVRAGYESSRGNRPVANLGGSEAALLTDVKPQMRDALCTKRDKRTCQGVQFGQGANRSQVKKIGRLTWLEANCRAVKKGGNEVDMCT